MSTRIIHPQISVTGTESIKSKLGRTKQAQYMQDGNLHTDETSQKGEKNMDKIVEEIMLFCKYHGYEIEKVEQTKPEFKHFHRTLFRVRVNKDQVSPDYYALEDAKRYVRAIREANGSCSKHLYLVTYETGSKRLRCIKFVSAQTAKDAVCMVQKPYYDAGGRGNKAHVPFPFSAKAHRVPDGISAEEAKERWLKVTRGDSEKLW